MQLHAAHKISYTRLIISIIVICICCCTGLFSQQKKIDSLFKVFSTERHDTGKVKILNALAQEFNKNNPDTALVLDSQALKIAEKAKWLKGVAMSLELLGAHQYTKGNFPEAMESCAASLEAYEKLHDKNGAARNLSNIGLVYKQWGKYPEAIANYFKALKLCEESEDRHGVALNLGNLGLVFMNQKDYAKALDHFMRALELDEKQKNRPGIARHLGNIGIVYKYLEDYPKALDCFTKALAINEELGKKSGIANNLGNIGIIYEKQGNSVKALEYYFKTLKIYEQSGNKTKIAHTLANIGSHISRTTDTLFPRTLRTAKYKEAEEYLKEALKLAEEAGALREMNTASRNLTNLYDKTERYELALNYYKKYIATRDSIFNEENIREQTETEMQYEFDKKQTAVKAEQEKKDAVAAEEKRKQSVITWVIASGVVLFGLFGIFMWIAFRQKQQANVEISLQKAIIEEKQKEIVDSIYYARRIQRSLLPTEKYISRVIQKLKS